MFQSTHPHGVRLCYLLFDTPQKCFNPRTHTGCDNNTFCAYKEVERVSIHAPTRGATKLGATCLNLVKFQSTHPHGVRQCAKLHIISQ